METNAPSTASVIVLLRHGESEANVAGIVVSKPENGVNGYGLTAAGREQARSAAAEILRLSAGRRVVLASSDFKRAAETADEVEAALRGKADVSRETVVGVRERGFGELELCTGERYAEVWALDAGDAGHTALGAESVRSVARRAVASVRGAVARNPGAAVVVVSHGDTLQILQAAWTGIDVAAHRSLPHLSNCGTRELDPDDCRFEDPE